MFHMTILGKHYWTLPLATKSVKSPAKSFVLMLTYRIANKGDGQSRDEHLMALQTLFRVATTELGIIDQTKCKQTRRISKDNYDEQMLRTRLKDQEREKAKLDTNFGLAAQGLVRMKKLRVGRTGRCRAVSCLQYSPAVSPSGSALTDASGARYEGQVGGSIEFSRNMDELLPKSRSRLFPDAETTTNFDCMEAALGQEMSPETDVNQPSANYLERHEAKPPATENYDSIEVGLDRQSSESDYMSADQTNASFPFDIYGKDLPDLGQIDFGAYDTGVSASTPVSKLTAAPNGRLEDSWVEDSWLLSLSENTWVNGNDSEASSSAINITPSCSDDVEVVSKGEIEDEWKGIVDLECCNVESVSTRKAEDAARSMGEVSFNVIEMDECGFPTQGCLVDESHSATPGVRDLDTPKKLGDGRDMF